uniref:Signal recognition particle subunit SRP72 n=1 Tax=Ciona savignyi TaxID=51511 RepID=H2ZNQ5_CIOSA
MAAQSPTNMTVLYGELNKFINVSDYKQALKAANKIIHTKEGKEDTEAMHCKAVCMMQMSQFAEALKFIEGAPEIKDAYPFSLLVFEKAYCQYRLLQTEDALDTINQVKSPDLRLLELKAQVLYKLGQYSASLALYKNLIKEFSDEFEEERMTNISAVHAALSAFDGVKTELGFKVESYEQLYNKGCWLLGHNRVVEAQKVLVQAEEVCRGLYVDDPDVPEEEIEGEISIIRVQLAYALQLQGKTDEALTIYNQVIRLRPTDIALVAVASNNIISINREQNVFDSRKKMKATIAPGLENKLVPFQKKKIDFNRALLFMYSNQVSDFILSHANIFNPITAYNLLLFLLGGLPETAEVITTRPQRQHRSMPHSSSSDWKRERLQQSRGILAGLVSKNACLVLEALGDVTYTPAVVSCLVSLYNAQRGGEVKAARLIERAIEWHKNNKSPAPILSSLMWESSEFALKHNNPKSAAGTLEEILRFEPKNVKVLAKLIFAYSMFNQTKAHQISENLPSLSDLSVHVDVDDLERNASRLAPRYVKKQKDKDVDAKDSSSATALIIKKKRKKKKNPVPKDFRENYHADDERWLPLRERSYYKGRRKDRKKGGVGKGTQGTHMGASDAYDMSHKTPTHAPNSPKPGSSGSGSHGNTPLNSPKPTQVKGAKPKKGGAGGKKKKKGKGGW